MTSQFRFAVLGPVRAWKDSTEINLGSPQQQTVLAALILAEGTYVPASSLVNAVWGDPCPPSAIGTIRTYVYRLRKSLEPAVPSARSVIRSRGDAYCLATSPDTCDLQAFKAMAARAEVARRADRTKDVALELTDALALWHGDALAGLKSEWAANSQHFLHELRLTAETDRMAAELSLGAGAEVANELARLVSRYPLDERVRALQMRALYQSGRQAAALATYKNVQDQLARELGIRPGPRLQSLHQQILRADPELLPGVSTSPRPAPGVRTAPSPARSSPAVAVHVLPEGLAAASDHFTGRKVHLRRVEAFLTCSGAQRKGPGILAVSGIAGIGKTAFALYIARRVADRYPDGRIVVDLRGSDQERLPLSADQAQRSVLRALGTAPELLQDPDAVAPLFQQALADRRMLLVLDNARTASQVSPLLPHAGGTLVVITSRDHLGGLTGDHTLSVPLEPFTAAESHAYLIRRLGNQRLTAEPEAAQKIIDRCRGLPLALAAAVTRVETLSAYPLAAAAQRLRTDGPGPDICDISPDRHM
ncbi:BTAD domain-containing putative transcriptional regulator [Streptomyces sp. NPDC046909]|uniref:AfsR/SARP family transcriptional regulator n=1 Tax=Streptomyces sp. NPDC046909 TaxID=3155617 RepID=UPI0033F6AEED